jgi:hypothetical protein
MGALAPGPEDAEQQQNGADDLANPPHGPKVSPCPRPRQKRHAAHARRARGNAGAGRSAQPSAPAAAASSSAFPPAALPVFAWHAPGSRGGALAAGAALSSPRLHYWSWAEECLKQAGWLGKGMLAIWRERRPIHRDGAAVSGSCPPDRNVRIWPLRAGGFYPSFTRT